MRPYDRPDDEFIIDPNKTIQENFYTMAVKLKNYDRIKIRFTEGATPLAVRLASHFMELNAIKKPGNPFQDGLFRGTPSLIMVVERK